MLPFKKYALNYSVVLPKEDVACTLYNLYVLFQIQFPIETFFFELGDFGMGHFDLGDFGLGDFDLGDFGVNDFRHAGDYGPVEDYGLAATYGEYNDYPVYGHYQGAKVSACWTSTIKEAK